MPLHLPSENPNSAAFNASARGPAQLKHPDPYEINQSARGPEVSHKLAASMAAASLAGNGDKANAQGAQPAAPLRAAALPPPAALLATALYDYLSDDPSHLPFRAGAVIEVLDDQEPWALGRLGGKKGWYPSSYTKKHERAISASGSDASTFLAETAPVASKPETDGERQDGAEVSAVVSERAQATTPQGSEKDEEQRVSASVTRQNSLPPQATSEERAASRPESPQRNARNSRPSTPSHRRALPKDYVCPYAQKYDGDVGAQVISWVSDVSGHELDASANFATGMHEALKSGVILCELANALKPGAVKRIERKEAPFQMRENIARFIAAAKVLGVPDNELFDVPDLFEAKQMRQVQTCLYALGRASHDIAGYNGPVLGKPVSYLAGAHKQSNFKVNANQGLWGKSGGAFRADAGKEARMRSATTTGLPENAAVVPRP